MIAVKVALGLVAALAVAAGAAIFGLARMAAAVDRAAGDED